MKKIISLILLFILIITMILTCKANTLHTINMIIDNPIMTIDGKAAEIDPVTKTSPKIIDGSAYIPIRAFIENLGGEVIWDNSKKEIILTHENNKISLIIGSNIANINNNLVNISSPPIILNSITLLPLRFISEGLGFDIEWNNTTKSVTITTGTSTNSTAEAVKNYINLTSDEITLDNGLSAISYDGNYMFDEFINQGGASSDYELALFLINTVTKGTADISFETPGFGCSTLSVKSPDNEYLFGRNFDWNYCNGLIIKSKPENNYASISTVNTDFISSNYKNFNSLPTKIKAAVALYAPLDGMNEKGLCAAVNMIQDNASINQNNNKPDITTTTAIRLILDKAANVDEAISLLKQYDMHSSMGFMVHFALADANGKSVVLEYIDNEMVVTETPIVTNFYISEGSKYGIGTSQSHRRYEILSEILSQKSTMSMNDVKNALDSVSKHNFGEYESTEWSIVYNQNIGEVDYYHRENYDKVYSFKIN